MGLQARGGASCCEASQQAAHRGSVGERSRVRIVNSIHRQDTA